MNTYIKTGKAVFDDLIPRVKAFLEQDIVAMEIDGESVRGYRSPDSRALWIRDHSDMLRMGRYFLDDPKSAVQHFADTQAANGRIFDYVTTNPEKPPCEKENWTKYVRIAVEADVEYRFVKAAFLSWQATGDDEWLLALMPAMGKALDYAFTHPHRVDEASGLVKRAYTIDTWDFAFTNGKHPWLQFQIDDNTYWGIFHGDNSGYYEALTIMEQLYNYFEKTGEGRNNATLAHRKEEIRKKTNGLCWNGRFYTHFVKLTPVTIDGVDEAEQLSMANPMSINRGLATHEMAVSIIREYIRRSETTGAFAGWFSIDPPFPDGIFGDGKLIRGAYINGGIFPLAGGELAMAAFNHGFETFGVSILNQYYDLISRNNETFLWYFPDGTPSSVDTSTSPDALPTDGWGSSAMAIALIEGLAGIVDRLKRFERIRLSPRWLAAGITEAEAEVGYPGSGTKGHGLEDQEASAGEAGVRYVFTYSEKELNIRLECRAEVEFHVLVGSGDEVDEVYVNGLTTDYQEEWVEKSRYVNFSAAIVDGAGIRITFKG